MFAFSLGLLDPLQLHFHARSLHHRLHVLVTVLRAIPDVHVLAIDFDSQSPVVLGLHLSSLAVLKISTIHQLDHGIDHCLHGREEALWERLPFLRAQKPGLDRPWASRKRPDTSVVVCDCDGAVEVYYCGLASRVHGTELGWVESSTASSHDKDRVIGLLAMLGERFAEVVKRKPRRVYHRLVVDIDYEAVRRRWRRVKRMFFVKVYDESVLAHLQFLHSIYALSLSTIPALAKTKSRRPDDDHADSNADVKDA